MCGYGYERNEKWWGETNGKSKIDYVGLGFWLFFFKKSWANILVSIESLPKKKVCIVWIIIKSKL